MSFHVYLAKGQEQEFRNLQLQAFSYGWRWSASGMTTMTCDLPLYVMFSSSTELREITKSKFHPLYQKLSLQEAELALKYQMGIDGIKRLANEGTTQSQLSSPSKKEGTIRFNAHFFNAMLPK